MSVNFYEGDLLKSNCTYICHQVNCQGEMKSGIAKQIRKDYPIVYNQYRLLCLELQDYLEHSIYDDITQFLLGAAQVVPIRVNKDGPTHFIVNLFAQDKYGYDGARYTSYDAFAHCLEELARQVPKGSKIGFPYGIGCGRGGGQWNVVLALITEHLAADYDVEIWRFNADGTEV